ncbi:MAG: leucyl/phenylalanyl-tRNA--protein transferase [Bacteroidota bacterium]
MPVFELPNDKIIFPHPSLAEESGLLAIGGDLSPERLIKAYANGIFPWYSQGEPLMWWSLDPRMVLFPQEFKASKSLRRLIRKQKFEVTLNYNFAEVMSHCASIPRFNQEETWITPEMMQAYKHLHKLGYAHSFESWYDNKLVGGLYGVSVGKAFFGESMFHTMTDASKVAFYHFINHIKAGGFHLVDAQMHTNHLASLGARLIDRSEYLEKLAKAVQSELPDKSFWKRQRCSQ